jgi:nitroimidazol reductase NimA-like FMN-containing flavoprotein (pyridoxamine 5'-phosphate oxidase superfamily)
MTAAGSSYEQSQFYARVRCLFLYLVAAKNLVMIGVLTRQEINEVLARCIVGRIGCSDGKRVYVVPINYVFDGKSIIAHSLEGMKINMMRKHPEVCFEVDEVTDLSNWRSVILWGIYQELKEERERYAAMKLFVDHMIRSRHAEAKAVTTNEVHTAKPEKLKPVIYRILLEEVTGRYEHS